MTTFNDPTPPPPTLAYRGPEYGGDVVLGPAAFEALRATRKWVRVASVLLYVGAGLLVLAGLASAVGAFGVRGGAGAGVGLVYVAFAALYVVPAVYLTRYANAIARLERSRVPEDLADALQAQKSFWKFVGLAVLIVVGFYALFFAGALVFGAF